MEQGAHVMKSALERTGTPPIASAVTARIAGGGTLVGAGTSVILGGVEDTAGSWVGGRLEMRDDGMTGDRTASDGVFTTRNGINAGTGATLGTRIVRIKAESKAPTAAVRRRPSTSGGCRSGKSRRSLGLGRATPPHRHAPLQRSRHGPTDPLTWKRKGQPRAAPRQRGFAFGTKRRAKDLPKAWPFASLHCEH